MDESSGWLMDTLDIEVPNIPDQRASLPLMTLAVNSKVLIQNMNVGNQETASSISFNTLRPNYFGHKNHCEAAGASYGEHQPSRSGDAKPGPQLRKEHTKSRSGCYTCKKRRIKCPENHPVCAQCTRRGLKCEWPELHSGQAGEIVKKSLSIPQRVELSTPIFTMQDFRLFDHFVQHAYPNKPTGDESVWTHEIPSIAHNFDYLLHAMLALSSSDIEDALSQHSPDLIQSAMSHRVLAIKYLNRALSTGLHTIEAGNAMLATCLVLAYQSMLMDEGIADYLTFVRGCVLVSIQMSCRGLKFLFKHLLSMDELMKIRPLLQGPPLADLGPVNAAYTSLEAFKHLCEREYEKAFHGHLVEIVNLFYSSSRDAYMSWMKTYALFSYYISHADFQTFIDPSNPVGQLLQSHLVAIHTLMTPVSIGGQVDRKATQLVNGMVRWLGAIHANIEPGMRRYYDWPVKRAEKVREWLQCERALVKA